MKRTLSHTIALLGTLLAMSIQSSLAQGVELGIRSGVNACKLVGIVDATPKAGLYVGGSVGYFFNDVWGIGSDVTLSMQGSRCRKDARGVEMKYNYNYLNIPLLAQYQFSLDSGHTFRLMAGVQLGIFLSADYEYTHPSVLGEGTISGVERFEQSAFHPVDFGASLGAQWLLSPNAAIEVRYTLGITQTHNGISNTLNGYYYISVPDNRNSVLQIGTTFSF